MIVSQRFVLGSYHVFSLLMIKMAEQVGTMNLSIEVSHYVVRMRIAS